MRKVIVTGGTGFIGKNLLPILSEMDAEFFLMNRRKQSNPAASNIQNIECDVLDHNSINHHLEKIQATHLIHLAWSISPSNVNMPENFDWLKASINLLEGFRNFGGKRVISVGSCFEYNWDTGYCKENITPTRSKSLYSSCKNSLREYMEAYCRHFGLEFVWPRLFFLFGAHENPDRLIPHIIVSLLKGQEATIKNGMIFRDYLYAKSAAKYLSKIIFNDVQGPINICSGIPIKLEHLGKMVAEIIGRPDLLKIESPETVSNKVLFGDSSNIEKLIPLEERIDLREGLEQTVEWWKKELSFKENIQLT
ncbi:NAD-dependent epimerase/dehydratase family protein [Cecembia calidifontis]|uniref:Nucleoside-diphosphate-sugar epimerase n=1 Tax=Cecembia calidifontis TaxID=1187080 RepID=A0A4Q7P9W8_9BACT|nr:NAD(P)-dependent oxidoreductase [Cecembia calidifontis]RZS96971.1 nucleoside-diphosphate-sugar epimerase [Cecembia calidifontis]